MLGLAITTLALTAVMFVLLRRLKMCGHMGWDLARMCTRVHFKKCQEVYVAVPGPVREYERRWSLVRSEHVWSNDEWLANYDPC